VTGVNTFLLPGPGVWCVVLTWTNATGITAAPSLSLGSNLGFGDLTEFGSGLSYSTNSGSTSAEEVAIIYATAPVGPGGSANQVTVSGLTGMSNGSFDLWIFPVANVMSLTNT